MEDFVSKIRGAVETRRLWILSPRRKDAYVPLFEGTFPEALIEAATHAGFWKTATQIWEADPTRPRLAGGAVKLWATIDVPRESPLRGPA
jgi:hypothetical protein